MDSDDGSDDGSWRRMANLYGTAVTGSIRMLGIMADLMNSMQVVSVMGWPGGRSCIRVVTYREGGLVPLRVFFLQIDRHPL
jgi:hypothetical protein